MNVTEIVITGSGKVDLRTAQALLDDYIEALPEVPRIVCLFTQGATSSDAAALIAKQSMQDNLPFELVMYDPKNAQPAWVIELIKSATSVTHLNNPIGDFFKVSALRRETVVFAAWDDEATDLDELVDFVDVLGIPIFDLCQGLLPIEFDTPLEDSIDEEEEAGSWEEDDPATEDAGTLEETTSMFVDDDTNEPEEGVSGHHNEALLRECLDELAKAMRVVSASLQVVESFVEKYRRG